MKKITVIIMNIILVVIVCSCSYVQEVPQLSNIESSLSPVPQTPVADEIPAAPDDTPIDPEASGEAPVQSIFPLTIEKAESTLINYLEAKKIGNEESYVYLYYPEDDFLSEWFIEYYRSLDEIVIDFIIEDMEKVNDYLSEFYVLIEYYSESGERPHEVYLRMLYLVGIVNDGVYIFNHPMDFYDEHRENFDNEKHDNFWRPDEPDNTRPREINGKPILQPGDPEYDEIRGY